MKHFFSALFLTIISTFPIVTTLKADSEVFESRTDSGQEWRKQRRVGVGLNFAGVYGVVGFQAELNLTPKWCAQIGYGEGGDYSSFAFQVKRVLGGRSLNPYLSTGIARWASKDDEPTGNKLLQPSFLSQRFLSEDQKMSPSYEEILWPVSLGLQYSQLYGPWVGTSVFLEINAITDVGDFKTAATGTLGMSYFF